MTQGGVHERVGRFELGVPPRVAFVAFTPRGETGWDPQWRPVFHGPATDDSAPGTVFEIEHDAPSTIWQVVERRRPEFVRYARVTPGVSAGTVTVRLTAQGGGTLVEVTYRMTALSPAGEQHLTAVDADPAASPTSWREPIEGHLRRR